MNISYSDQESLGVYLYFFVAVQYSTKVFFPMDKVKKIVD